MSLNQSIWILFSILLFSFPNSYAQISFGEPTTQTPAIGPGVPTGEPGGVVIGEPTTNGPAVEIGKESIIAKTVFPLMTDSLLANLDQAGLARDIAGKLNYYKLAFNELLKSYKNFGLVIDPKIKNSYIIIIFETIEGLMLQDLSAKFRKILTELQQNQDYANDLKEFEGTLGNYDAFINTSVGQFTSGADTGLQEYRDKRNPLVFTLYFELLLYYTNAIQDPSKEDLITARSYFDRSIQQWGANFTSPPTWMQKLSFPGFGSSVEIMQTNFQSIADFYVSYALHQFDDIQNWSAVDDFNGPMKSNIEIIKIAKDNIELATRNFYTKLATIYKTDYFVSLHTTYETLYQSLDDGIVYFGAKDYQEAADRFSSVLTQGLPIVSNILITKDKQVIGDSSVAGGEKILSESVNPQLVDFVDEMSRMVEASQVNQTLDFAGGINQNLTSTINKYRDAITAYSAARDAIDVASIKSYFNTIIQNITDAIAILDNVNQALKLTIDADKLLLAVTTTEGVDSIDNSYKQAISLVKTADSKSKMVSKDPDYVLIYTELEKWFWSFEKFFKMRAGLLFKDKADAIDPATYATDLTKKAFVYDLYLKAYEYRDTIPYSDGQEVQKKLQETDLLTQADALKEQAKKATNWQPMPGLDHYASEADNAWRSTINAYFAAYEINKSTGTLFPGADQAYQNALIEYATMYNDNVGQDYYKSIGLALIYYRAYLERIAAGDSSIASNHEKLITDYITTFFNEVARIRNNMHRENYDIARYYYDRAIFWRTNFQYFFDEQGAVYQNQDSAASLAPETKKLLTQTSGDDGLTVGSDFGMRSAALGNIEQDFADWSANQADSFRKNAESKLDQAVSAMKQDAFDPTVTFEAQTEFNNAVNAYNGAAGLYNQLKNSTQASSMTSSGQQVSTALYACAQLNSVNQQLPATFFGKNVYGLYFAKPAFWQVPPDLLDITITELLKKYSLTTQDQEKLYHLASKYVLSDADWKQFTQYFNELQLPLRYPLKLDSWKNIKAIFDNYSLDTSEQDQIVKLTAKYTISDTDQTAISGFIFYLPALIYLYKELAAHGQSLSAYKLTYPQIRAYFGSLKGKPVDSEQALQNALGLSARDSSTIHGYLVDSYSYLNKMVKLLTTGIKGNKAEIFLYGDVSGNIWLVENNKPIPALPPTFLGNWYPSPSLYYKYAQSYFGTLYKTINTAINELLVDVWLSATYQTKLKTDYFQGVFNDEETVNALSYSDEYQYLKIARDQINAMKALFANKKNDPQAILNYSLNDSEHQTVKNIKYYYLSMMTYLDGAGLDESSENDALAQMEEEYGAALSYFLVGDPLSADFIKFLSKDISPQFLAAMGLYTDKSKADQAALKLSTILTDYGYLASVKELPMDPTKIAPKIFLPERFVLHDWYSASMLYANGAQILDGITAERDQMNTALINSLRSYYHIMVEDMSAYLLLRTNQGAGFNALAEKYSKWYAQQQAVEREFVDITEDEIELYQDINNLLLDSLIYLTTVSELSKKHIASPADDATKAAVEAYLKEKNISTLLTDTATFSATKWQDLQNVLTKAFDDLIPVSQWTTNPEQSIQKINILADSLFSDLQTRFILDWEGPDIDETKAAEVIGNLIDAMRARVTAMKSVNYIN